LHHFKVGSTRKQIAVVYGQKGGKDNLAILENLVITSAHLHCNFIVIGVSISDFTLSHCICYI
jgi:hypothetical protein